MTDSRVLPKTSLSVVLTHSTILSPEEVNRVFFHRLDELIGGRWIEGDLVMEEHATSHRFDSPAGRVTDPEFALMVAAYRLRCAIKDEEAKQTKRRQATRDE